MSIPRIPRSVHQTAARGGPEGLKAGAYIAKRYASHALHVWRTTLVPDTVTVADLDEVMDAWITVETKAATLRSLIEGDLDT